MSGSLRRGSYNSALLRAAAELLPEGMTLDIVTLDDIPLYNEDLLSDAGFPESVQQLRARIADADAAVILLRVQIVQPIQKFLHETLHSTLAL